MYQVHYISTVSQHAAVCWFAVNTKYNWGWWWELLSFARIWWQTIVLDKVTFWQSTRYSSCETFCSEPPMWIRMAVPLKDWGITELTIIHHVLYPSQQRLIYYQSAVKRQCDWLYILLKHIIILSWLYRWHQGFNCTLPRLCHCCFICFCAKTKLLNVTYCYCIWDK